MTETELGRLQQITDLRTVWETEVGGFTPWLATEGNLKLLGDTVGIELELEATEKDVGPFRADILCKDTATGDWVLVENQLERTDHTHLGQLLTYAAGLKAVTIVWLADRFTEEHRAALDWLNEITDDRFNFFGLEIELWRIGDSPIAPKFNVACKPNDWTKTVAGGVKRIDDSGYSETKLLQQKYWSKLRQLLLDRDGIVKPQKAHPQHWTNFAIGRSAFSLWATVNTQKNVVRVGLDCRAPHAKPHFYLLEEDKQAIEQDFGESLNWEPLPNRKVSQITLVLNDADPTDQADWPRQHRWTIEKLETFHRVFSGRVKTLDASDYRPAEATPEGE